VLGAALRGRPVEAFPPGAEEPPAVPVTRP
jgi:hypothetical protein